MLKKTILIVDDEPSVLTTLERVLQNAGYDVLKASDGREALAMVDYKPDLVILDVMMPVLDGYQVCKLLQENPETRKIPIVFLSARGKEEDKIIGLSLGAQKYLVKPCSKPELLKAVQIRLKQSETTKEIFERSPETLKGDLSSISIQSLVELFYVGGWSGGIFLTGESKNGRIHFENGLFTEAETEGLKGRDAFGDLLSWRKGQFFLKRKRKKKSGEEYCWKGT